MTTFADLIAAQPGLEPQDIQDCASRLLPERVRQTSMQWLDIGSPPNGNARKLLIGVAVWNRYDLQLLDRVAEFLAITSVPISVAVFDLDQLASTSDLDRLIPGVTPVVQTPAVGYWDGGLLRETGQGYFGRALVARALGIEESSVHPPALVTR